MSGAGDVGALVERARKAIDDKKLGEARGLLEESLALEPGDMVTLDLLGFVCFFLGDYASCERACRAALAQKPDHAYATKGLGLALVRQGQVDEGIRKLERAAALEPGWLDPHWDLIVILIENGRWKEAAEAVENGRAMVPAAGARFAALDAKIRAHLK